jgi:hypothetical protein
MITKVASFQTSDGSLHPDKVAALEREYFLELRGLIHGVSPRVAAAQSLTTTEIATILKTNAVRFKEIITKYEYSLNRALSEAKKTICKKTV